MGAVAWHEKSVGGDTKFVNERQVIFEFWIVQRIIQASNTAGGIAESRMGSDIVDPLPLKPYLTPVIRRDQKISSGEQFVGYINYGCSKWAVNHQRISLWCVFTTGAAFGRFRAEFSGALPPLSPGPQSP